MNYQAPIALMSPHEEALDRITNSEDSFHRQTFRSEIQRTHCLIVFLRSELLTAKTEAIEYRNALENLREKYRCLLPLEDDEKGNLYHG